MSVGRGSSLSVVLLVAAASVSAQSFSHPPRPDPALQRAAAAAQQAQLEAADQFGTFCCQILQIPASAFREIDPDFYGEIGSGGLNPGYASLRSLSATGLSKVWAPVTLPSGVALDFLDLYFLDFDGTQDLCVDLIAYPGTISPTSSILSTTCSSGSPGFGYESNVASGTINNNVLGGGAQYAVVLYADNPIFNLQFKAVDIWWHRKVSPAPATATFNDVPTSHPQFQFIEALAESGITVGCGGGNYCPNSSLTRGQMAVFLAKALGLYWPF
jgi:S-layer homology domain